MSSLAVARSNHSLVSISPKARKMLLTLHVLHPSKARMKTSAHASRTESLEAIFRLSVLLTLALLVVGCLYISRDLAIQNGLTTELRANPWLAQGPGAVAPRRD